MRQGCERPFSSLAAKSKALSEAQDTLRRMAEAGHELGNHTYSHPYELCKLPQIQIDLELTKAHKVIAGCVGESFAPVGFRSPGYFVNGKVMRVLRDHGYIYDSSMFPSPPYYLAKAAVMAGMGASGASFGSCDGRPSRTHRAC